MRSPPPARCCCTRISAPRRSPARRSGWRRRSASTRTSASPWRPSGSRMPSAPRPTPPLTMEALTPRRIVEELDKYIVGQGAAKRAVAIALRNRYRRGRIAPYLRDEVIPKNILMIGPTGIGKTEIARRLARLAAAPFVKVEATKFTEVGYVGRDVESMVRDLAVAAVQMVRAERMRAVEARAAAQARERLIELLAPSPRRDATFANPLEA